MSEQVYFSHDYKTAIVVRGDRVISNVIETGEHQAWCKANPALAAEQVLIQFREQLVERK